MYTYLVFLLLVIHSKVYDTALPPVSSLNREDIKDILNGGEQKSIWSNYLNQNIIYHDDYQSLKGYISDIEKSSEEIKDFNVLSVLQKYITDDNSKVEIEVLRNLIQQAVDCNTYTKLNLLAMLLYKDFLPFLNGLTGTIKPPPGTDNVTCKVVNNKTDCVRVIDKYSVNIVVKSERGETKFNAMGNSDNLEINPGWKVLIGREITLDANYLIKLEEFYSMFNHRETLSLKDLELFEIVSTLLTTMYNTGQFLQKKCVAHSGSCLKRYQSLRGEFGDEFMQYIKELEENENASPFERELFNTFLQKSAEREKMLEETPEETPVKTEAAKQANQCADVQCGTRCCPILAVIHTVNYKDENVASSFGSKCAKCVDKCVRNALPNAVNRKLTISMSSENKDEKKSHNASDAKYQFSGTVNVLLS